ncbi:MAG: hypothetical protein HYX89_06550 [Chloroflexi bacterium]|nr:hypothetical protein [Chloroflexota bacterium]
MRTAGHGKHSHGDDASRGSALGKKAPSFVIVLWLEDGEIQGEPEWRWRVTHVQTEEQAYFRRLADVLTYVSAKAGVSPPC